MLTAIRYARQRYFEKRQGWGRPWVKCLWLDALLFGVARSWTLCSPRFRKWCRQVNHLFRVQYDWPSDMTADTGRDCWIDPYWQGLSPQDAVWQEVDHWEP